jgi:flagellar L-ring protein precursor FlgH
MFADKKAYAVGDILTILVQENSTASKDNSTKTSKQSDVDAALATFLYSPAASGMLTHNGQMPALKYSSKQNFDGGGTINNQEQIVAKVAVKVVDVLPNQQLVIEGTRQTSFAGESQDIVLRGTVRTEDIAANNTVFSYNVADANIKFVNKGTVTDSQRKGWFTKIWELITPF